MSALAAPDTFQKGPPKGGIKGGLAALINSGKVIDPGKKGGPKGGPKGDGKGDKKGGKKGDTKGDAKGDAKGGKKGAPPGQVRADSSTAPLVSLEALANAPPLGAGRQAPPATGLLPMVLPPSEEPSAKAAPIVQPGQANGPPPVVPPAGAPAGAQYGKGNFPLRADSNMAPLVSAAAFSVVFIQEGWLGVPVSQYPPASL